MTDSSKTTNQSQSSSTSPWAPAMPLVSSLLGQYGALNPGVTANQGGALTNLNNSVSNLPNFGAEGASGINSIFSGANSAPQVGMLNTAYDTLKTNLSPTASGANLNPYDTPGFGDAIRTAINDTTNQVKGVYAGSGRDPSGAGSFAQSLGRGITQGISPTIANQYGLNYGNFMGANNALFQGAGSTASSINNLRAGDTASTLAGLQGASAIPGLYASPSMAQLGAANAQYSQPYSNLAQLLQPTTALAGLGSNTSGTGTSVQTSSPSLLSNIGTGVSAAGTAAGLPWGSILAALGGSDERIKENKHRVGKLHDGTNVWSYNYIGDKTPRMGVMAQEVEKRDPAAVVEVGGIKMVNYKRVTDQARVGALRRAA